MYLSFMCFSKKSELNTKSKIYFKNLLFYNEHLFLSK